METSFFVTTSKAPVTTSVAPVTTSAAPVTTSVALVTTSVALVTTSVALVTTSFHVRPWKFVLSMRRGGFASSLASELHSCRQTSFFSS